METSISQPVSVFVGEALSCLAARVFICLCISQCVTHSSATLPCHGRVRARTCTGAVDVLGGFSSRGAEPRVAPQRCAPDDATPGTFPLPPRRSSSDYCCVLVGARLLLLCKERWGEGGLAWPVLSS